MKENCYICKRSAEEVKEVIIEIYTDAREKSVNSKMAELKNIQNAENAFNENKKKLLIALQKLVKEYGELKLNSIKTEKDYFLANDPNFTDFFNYSTIIEINYNDHCKLSELVAVIEKHVFVEKIIKDMYGNKSTTIKERLLKEIDKIRIETEAIINMINSDAVISKHTSRIYEKQRIDINICKICYGIHWVEN